MREATEHQNYTSLATTATPPAVLFDDTSHPGHRLKGGFVNTRRQFLITAQLGLLSTIAA